MQNKNIFTFVIGHNSWLTRTFAHMRWGLHEGELTVESGQLLLQSGPLGLSPSVVTVNKHDISAIVQFQLWQPGTDRSIQVIHNNKNIKPLIIINGNGLGKNGEMITALRNAGYLVKF